MDYEWYLRRMVEDQLLAGRSTELAGRSAALVAAGVLTAEQARSVLSDHRRAWSARGRDDLGPVESESTVMPPPPLRVIACNQGIRLGWGTLTLDYVSLSSRRSLFATRVVEPGGSRQGVLPSVAQIGVGGVQYGARFSGGVGSDSWEGVHTVEPGLDLTTPAVEIFGETIALPDLPSRASVTVEPRLRAITPGERAEAFVRRQLELTGRGWPDNAVATVCDTYVDCGLLPVDAPVLDDVVAAHVAKRAGGGPAAVRRGGPRRDGGANKCVSVAVTSPIVDNAWVSVLALISSDTGFRVDVESSRPLLRLSPDHASDRLISVFAVDDRGQTYAAHPGFVDAGPDYDSVQLRFDHPLDPELSWLDVVFGLASARLIVRIPLAQERP